MKIAFPTGDNESIAGHFGNMKAMLAIDVDGGVEAGREHRDMTGMPACDDSQQTRPDYVIGVVRDCDVVIANGIDAPLVHKMQHVGVEVVLTSNPSIVEAAGGLHLRNSGQRTRTGARAAPPSRTR